MKKLVIIISLILVSSLNLFAGYYSKERIREMADTDKLEIVTEVLIKEYEFLKKEVKQLKQEVEKLKKLRGK